MAAGRGNEVRGGMEQSEIKLNLHFPVQFNSSLPSLQSDHPSHTHEPNIQLYPDAQANSPSAPVYSIQKSWENYCISIELWKKRTRTFEKLQISYYNNFVLQEVTKECLISSCVSHSDGSCVLGRIHSDVSSNIPKNMYHIVTDNFVNLLHISYAWLYKTEFWGSKFHAFSFNSHRNCKIFMTNFNFIFDTICVPYIFRKSIFGWNCDHDTPLCDTPLLEDTPLCDTPDDL